MAFEIDLDGKVVLVTGASSGIGAEIAEAMGTAGARVMLVGRDAGRLDASVERVAATGAETDRVVADVTDDDAPQRLIGAAVEKWGRLGAYCATKGAIELMTRALASEEGPNGVRFNAIAPGNVETPMNAHLMANPDYLRQMLEATPLGRNGVPADIAPMAVLLASGRGGYLTGTSVLIDGGWAAQ